MDDWTLTNWIRQMSNAEAKLITDVGNIKTQLEQLQQQLTQLQQQITTLQKAGDKHE